MRTLHHYDDIDLLKPSHYEENRYRYRYYEDEQLFMLQQILFYKELGFSLGDIQKVLNNDAFDTIEALQKHRHSLTSKLKRSHTLIELIDKTIMHLRGEEMVNLEDIFEGFTAEKQDLYMDFLIKNGIRKDGLEKTIHWSKEQWLDNKQQADQILFDLSQLIDDGLSVSSPQVQALIRRHFDLVAMFWIPSKDTYIKLAHFYESHTDFVAFHEGIHPNLLPFMIEAMTVFANNELM